MNEIKATGKQHIGSLEFISIEGGFGEGKKAMTVNDIADIHRREVKVINQAINMNRKRFKDGVDIIDLKSVVNQIDLEKFGYSQNAINRSNNIYILSERGYAKLLKILEDDTAWEIYDELVDNYFSMRESIKLGTTEQLKQKRLEIMEENAKTKRAELLFKSAMGTKSESAKEQILSDVVYELTGERRIPIMKQKEYSAGEVAESIGDGLTANMVGRICNKLELKAEKPGQNKYGRWANGKSEHSPKEVPQWLYFDKGLEAIRAEWNRALKEATN
ncbi:ORF6N domain-containing protein [Enterococcus rotai]|uniref:ORF6N domain-containing protein n=1 Tax=Enterococcus rotai TaxID=118060 RepID=UPI0032B61B69